jgi:hypothetical protein
MDRDSVDVVAIADNDPTNRALEFGSRMLGRFEERLELFLAAIASGSQRKACFHIRCHDVNFPIDGMRCGSNDRGDCRLAEDHKHQSKGGL